METKSNTIDSELGLISEDLARVEEVLYQEARSEAQLIFAVSDHILKSGGKRFRPALLLLPAQPPLRLPGRGERILCRGH